ncbi:MAG: acyltransferase [Dolichospermum sp. JUN01]|jgi:peptidoglycan/LPS O-acetylase OafA/YrhL|nr:acyltransferase [Dolichospermum sp. JUN01]MBS9393480.1 acyltransferase [Dolichospermum sp. OL01]MCO5797115.1 acyltransferase [Dolichospermum sp. OL03]MCS6279706.1 acyltransferase [Dolichospermum sp.]QSV55214.1 MAG: acyltransferase [Dolichospermum sp. UKL201]QSV58663.1 MAG: acyltransferase [Dolichospermum sp. LBC05a]
MTKTIEKSTEKRLHLPYLDGLRGLASLYVVLVHVEPGIGDQLPESWSLFVRAMKYGAFSVISFVVLSGYVLMLPVARSENGQLSGSLINYIKRRARRILPPYYMVLFICLLLAAVVFIFEKFTSFQWNEVAGIGSFSPKFSLINFLLHLLIIHNLDGSSYLTINPPMWTVATEWQIYFLFPLLLLPIWRQFGLFVVVIIAFLIGLTPVFLLNGLFESANPWLLGVFCLGMAAADIGFSQKPKLVAIRNSLPWGWLAIIFTCIAFITEWRPLGLHIWINQTFAGLAFACLFISLSKSIIEDKKPSLILRILQHPLAIALGTFSYSLYLTHGPVLVLVRYCLFYLPISPDMFAAGCYLLGTVMSLIIAYWFYLYFERPFMSSFLKKRKVKDAVI